MSFDILPECATAPPAAQLRYVWRSTGLALINVAALVGAIQGWPGAGLVPVLYAVFVATLLVAGYEVYRLLSALDEMQRRIHVAALALAGAGTTGIGTIWGVGALLFAIPAPHAVFAAPVLWVSYYASLVFVARRFT